MIDEIVRRLKPKYIGFRLILYKPFSLNSVSSLGKPNLVEEPRLNQLMTAASKPAIAKKILISMASLLFWLLKGCFKTSDEKNNIHVT